MNKLKTAILFIFLLLPLRINAQDIKFGWNIGNVNIYYDAFNNELDGDFEMLHLNWLFNKFSIGVNILNLNGFNSIDDNEIYQYLLLPLEIAWVPLNYNDWLFFSVYGNAGWQLTENKNDSHIHNGFYGSIGIQLFMFPELKIYYSPYLSLFTEYDTNKKLKMGLGIDLSAIIFFALKGYQERKEKEYDMSFDWTSEKKHENN